MRSHLPLLTALILALAPPLAAQDAAPDHAFTVMTYNIKVGLGNDAQADPETNLRLIAELISAEGAEVVFLQEVDRGVARSESLDEPAFLAALLEMNFFHAPALTFGGGEYGTALLTSWEILESEVVPLPHDPDVALPPGVPDYYNEPRVLHDVLLGKGDRRLRALNVHLGLRQEERQRHIGEILERIEEEPEVMTILAGDFNAEPDAVELCEIRGQMRDAYHGHLDARGLRGNLPIRERLTFPSDDPNRCIDFLFVQGGEPAMTQVLPVTLSDHRPVVTEIRPGR